MSRPVRAWVPGIVALALACAGLGTRASGQGIAYCNVTGVKTTRLANAVKIAIEADGLMRLKFDPNDFFNWSALTTGSGDWRRQVSELNFHLTNARCKAGSFADVGVFPASHVEFSIPQDAPEGVGLDIKVALYVPGTPVSLKLPNWNITIGFSSLSGPQISVQMTEDSRQLIIIVTRDAHAEPRAERRARPEGAPVELSAEAENGTLAVHALNADLRDVAREAARAAGTRVAVDSDVERVVSLSVRGVTFGELMEALESAYGLAGEEVDGVLRLHEGEVASNAAYQDSTVQTVRLNHLSAADARNCLPEFLLRHVHVDAGQNALVVAGPRQLVAKIAEDVAKLDRPVPLIEVEGLLVEYSDDDTLDLALDQAGRDRWNAFGFAAATGDISYQFLGPLPAQFAAKLEALRSQGRVRIRARPRAVALNGQTAQLFAGRQAIFKVDYFDQNYSVMNTRLLSLDVGVKLAVTPWTGGNGEITAAVAPKVDDIIARETGTGLPTLATRRASTVVRMRDGDTILLGGLSLGQHDRARQGIPVLSDLPLLGGLFQTHRQERSTTHTALFVTARIVRGSASQATVAAALADPMPKTRVRRPALEPAGGKVGG